MIEKVKKLEKEIGSKVRKRLKEFENNKDWFGELCFCILTANSKAKTALKIEKEVGNFLNLTEEELKEVIKKNKHRFHNRKARYIIEARKFKDIKKFLGEDKREWLVKNVKGLGMKESSHFLRNIGFFDYAILDRHVLNVMKEEGIIEDSKLNKKRYLEIEEKFKKISEKLGMSMGELDLYVWYMKTGEVLK
ncbi:N-glycosylase [archaeon]|nr:N-glycosylase [archaeon]|tara:strand:- start:6709 stop:7284 length:576 start_codon:yes stop_codon:yes gene_type:complete